MTVKLTLTIDEAIIEKAKIFAKANGRSLSDVVENYLKMITSAESPQQKDISPITKSLRGSFNAPEDFDYKNELTKVLKSKYE